MKWKTDLELGRKIFFYAVLSLWASFSYWFSRLSTLINSRTSRVDFTESNLYNVKTFRKTNCVSNLRPQSIESRWKINKNKIKSCRQRSFECHWKFYLTKMNDVLALLTGLKSYFFAFCLFSFQLLHVLM